MAATLVNSVGLSEHWGLPPEYGEARWYVAHTCANHEKRVAEQLAQRDVENFLPLYEVTRRRRGRRLWAELPLFPGYVFVRLALKDRLRVLQIPSVVRLVGFKGQAARVPDAEVDALRACHGWPFAVEPHPYLRMGERVRITSGALAGIEGILRRKKAGYRLVLSVHILMKSVAIEMDAADVEPLRQITPPLASEPSPR